ncbi:MAG: hypothetical protein U5R48_04065 [Gammaproteobacteria bacterium]|nr:hypothetical protein [Gammaproteobacteria bacterium]
MVAIDQPAATALAGTAIVIAPAPEPRSAAGRPFESCLSIRLVGGRASMRIVTLNTWKCEGDYDRRLACMADSLAALAPDVVCLQECFVGAGSDTLHALAAATGLRPYASPAREKTRTFRGRPVTSTSGLGMLVDGEVSGFSRVDLPSEPRDRERAAQIVRPRRPDGDHARSRTCTSRTSRMGKRRAVSSCGR